MPRWSGFRCDVHREGVPDMYMTMESLLSEIRRRQHAGEMSLRHTRRSQRRGEVPAPPSPAGPVVPDTPATPADPDPGTPADPAQPSTVPPPVEPAEPIAPVPGPDVFPEPDVTAGPHAPGPTRLIGQGASDEHLRPQDGSPRRGLEPEPRGGREPPPGDHTHPEPRTRQHPIPLAPGEEPAVDGPDTGHHGESHEDDEPEQDSGS